MISKEEKLFHIIMALIMLITAIFFITSKTTFEKYCIKNWWEFLTKSNQCYYSEKFYESSSELEKDLFLKNR